VLPTGLGTARRLDPALFHGGVDFLLEAIDEAMKGMPEPRLLEIGSL